MYSWGKFRTLFIVSVLSFSPLTFAKWEQINAGEPIALPRTLSVEWLSGGTCTASCDSSWTQTGTLKITATFVNTTATVSIGTDMALSNTVITGSVCVRQASQSGNCASFAPLSGVSCSSADKGSFNTCLTRQQGVRYSFVVPITLNRYRSGGPVCAEVYVYPQLIGSQQSLNNFGERHSSLTFCDVDAPGVIPNPEETVSVCTLDNQTIPLTFTSSSLNTSGLSQTKDMYINCSAGKASNYTLRLSAITSVNGRIDFLNGVSAQVSLNGTPVVANGPGISLENTTSRTLTVGASLVGNATQPGTSNAYGILVLEAL